MFTFVVSGFRLLFFLHGNHYLTQITFTVSALLVIVYYWIEIADRKLVVQHTDFTWLISDFVWFIWDWARYKPLYTANESVCSARESKDDEWTVVQLKEIEKLHSECDFFFHSLSIALAKYLIKLQLSFGELVIRRYRCCRVQFFLLHQSISIFLGTVFLAHIKFTCTRRNKHTVVVVYHVCFIDKLISR